MFNRRKHIGLDSGFNSSPLAQRRTSGGSTPVYHLSSALHEWYYKNSTVVGTTVTSVDTGSVGGMNMANPDVSSEPIVNIDNIQFDGVSQYQIKNIANFRGADTTGCVHIKFIPTDNTFNQVNYFFTSADINSVSLVGFSYVNLKIRINIRTPSLVLILDTVNAMTINTINTVSIFSNGTTIKLYLNGVLQSLSLVLGTTNDGRWFNFSPDRDNLAIGALITTSNVFGKLKNIYESYTPYINDSTVLLEHNDIRLNAI